MSTDSPAPLVVDASGAVSSDGATLVHADVLAHRTPERYPGQRVAVVDGGGYALLVPYVEADDHLYLKTVIPSRKATRTYLGGMDDG